jgi:hypothetical protein
MDLVKQLEDKKKGCGEMFQPFLSSDEFYNDEEIFWKCGDLWNEKPLLCPSCKAEIAILEQAIAKIEKQRQEILDEIGYKIFSEDEQKSNNVWYKKGWDDNASRINKELQQLNQPKTDENNNTIQNANN